MVLYHYVKINIKEIKFNLKIVRDFQKTYLSNKAIWWLTKDIFLLELLNKSFKTDNIDLLLFLRFFIHDIKQQLHQYQCLTLIKVYKYQLISNKDLQLLKNSIGQFISINNFLLTNIDRDSVLSFSKVLSTSNDYQSILFEIDANFDLNKNKPFGNITSLKYSQNDQNEILFMLGSIFQIENISQDDNNNNLWIIKMTLTSKTNETLKPIFQEFINENDNINLLSLGYILQKMNKLNEAEKYYHRLYNELPDNDEHITGCCLNLGNLLFLKHNYDISLEWLLKSLDISTRTLSSNDKYFAFIYNSMGHVYNAKNNIKLSIESYTKAIIIWKQYINENYLDIAQTMNYIGLIYKHEKDYLLALECFKKTLYLLKNYVLDNHFDLNKTYSNIGSIYRQINEYDLALENYYLSLNILKKYYTLNHPNIAKGLANIGIIYALKGEKNEALKYYEEAAIIYRHTLPLTHINNIQIEQLIRNVSFPNRRLSFGSINSQ